MLDIVGGDYLARSIDCMAVEERSVVIGFVRGPKAEANLFPVMTKRLTLTGSTLRARPLAYKQALAAQLRETVWPLIAQGRPKPVVCETFPLAAAAHRLMESNRHVGKIVLRVQYQWHGNVTKCDTVPLYTAAFRSTGSRSERESPAALQG